jgi:DNA (cytosine-5)-methyltransferase 1
MLNLPYLIRNGFVEAPDIIVGGTPCQAFSVAGARQSLGDDRGKLTLAFLEIIEAIDEVRLKDGKQPVIIVWENVPGVLGTIDNAFGCFLGGLCGSGDALQPTGRKWGNNGYIVGPKRQAAYRVLDAQFFGVAQRRRRVFVVSSARNGFDPSSILFEFDGVRRDSPPSRETRENIAPYVGVSLETSSRFYDRQRSDEWGTQEIASTIARRDYKSFTDLIEVVHGTQDPLTQSERAFPLGRNSGQENAVFAIQGSMIGRNDNAGPQGSGISEDVSFTLTRGDRHAVGVNITFCDANGTRKDRPNGGLYISQTDTANTVTTSGTDTKLLSSAVRRFTPKECERLQGFPDDWTKIPYRGKDAENCPDGPRYAACGNSMAVPVMHWIGKRIDALVNIEYHAGRGVYL